MGGDSNAKVKLPYEPPRIFDLWTSSAYAQTPACTEGSGVASFCTVGGTPAQECKTGGAATGGKCQSGSTAALECVPGSAPSGGKCQSGNTPIGV